jgi:hypothetical protein
VHHSLYSATLKLKVILFWALRVPSMFYQMAAMLLRSSPNTLTPKSLISHRLSSNFFTTNYFRDFKIAPAELRAVVELSIENTADDGTSTVTGARLRNLATFFELAPAVALDKDAPTDSLMDPLASIRFGVDTLAAPFLTGARLAAAGFSEGG